MPVIERDLPKVLNRPGLDAAYGFGEALLRTGDLDPVYIGLKALSGSLLKRWLVAYWCFYHCGAASYIAERTSSAFWKLMLQAAQNLGPSPCTARWPRSAERRHFRGMDAVHSIQALAGRYPQPERFVDYLAEAGVLLLFTEVKARVEEHVLFGPWIAYKIADMLERVLQVPVNFSSAEVLMYKEPTAAALLLWPQHPAYSAMKTEQEGVKLVATDLVKHFRRYKAPPWQDRPCGIAEVETCLCKFKSYWNKHYWVGKDIHEVRAGLQPWLLASATARALLEALPEEVEPCKRLW